MNFEEQEEKERRQNWKIMEVVVKKLIDFLITTQTSFKYNIGEYGKYSSDGYGLATYIDILSSKEKIIQTFIIKDNGVWIKK